MNEKEEQFRAIQNAYDSYTYMFYEAMHGGNYTFEQACKQGDTVIEEIQKMRRL